MRRREFMLVLAGLSASGGAAAQQQAPLASVAVLGSSSENALRSMLPHFHEGLAIKGQFVGKTLTLSHDWANGQYDRLPGLAAQIIRRNPAAIFAIGDSAWAAKQATTTMPIVFANGSDPVEAGLVTSLNRPNSNVTGASWTSNPLGPKRLVLLRDAVPKLSLVGALLNRQNPSAPIDARAMEAAASQLGMRLSLQFASSEDELASAFAAFSEAKVDALIVGADSFFVSRLSMIVGLAARHSIPASYTIAEYARAGGLMSYGPPRTATFKVAGEYVARILAGETPAALPVQLPTRFELILNLKAARTLGLAISPVLQAVADDVIE